MSTTTAGWLQAGLLVAALAACYVPLGNYMAHIFTTDKDWQRRALHLPADGHRLQGRPEVERLRPQHPGLLRGQRAVPVRTAASAALPAVQRAHDRRAAGHRLEHGRVVRDQHELAELRRRVHHGLPGADDRPDRAAVHVGRRWPGGRDRDDPRLYPVQDRQARELLGGRHPRVVPAADPAGGHRRPDPCRQRRDRELPRLHDVHDAVRRAPDDPRWPGGLDGIHQGPGEQRRRLVQHQRRASVREPEPVDELADHLLLAADPVRHSARLRQDGQGQPAGLRPGRGHGRHLAARRRRHQLLRGALRSRRCHRRAPRAWRHRRRGNEVRHARLLVVRGVYDGDLHRIGELFP